MLLRQAYFLTILRSLAVDMMNHTIMHKNNMHNNTLLYSFTLCNT